MQHILIKKRAVELGFDACGIASCEPLSDDMRRLEEWIVAGHSASMGYMSRNGDKRADPRLLVEGARSAIVCIISYKTDVVSPHIASFALSEDYHFTLKSLLNRLLDYLKEIYPGAEGRAFVDSAPLFERSLAVRAGLGWIGRNSMLVSREHGSFTFIATIITNAALECDAPYAGEYCRGCRLCIDNCPTGAICDNRTVDASRCLSYHTIENRDAVPQHIASESRGAIFGCDACQSICPHNAKTKPHAKMFLSPVENITAMTPADWLAMSNSEFRRRFGRTPLARAGLRKLKETTLITFPSCYSEKL